MTDKNKGQYTPDWRIDSIDEGQQAADKAEQDFSDRDQPRRAIGGGSDHSIFRYEDQD